MDDYEQDYNMSCPKCNHTPIHYRVCQHCEDGFNDEHENDAINFMPGESLIRCNECYGAGTEIWCPKCGCNISQYNYEVELKERTVRRQF